MKPQLCVMTVLMFCCALAVAACDTEKKNDNKSLLLLLLGGSGGNLAIGDNYQGGKIACIFQSGDPGFVMGETHGLIAAPNDETDYYEWKTTQTSTTGTSTELGTGYANTYNYMTGTEHPAAEVVRNATYGGYDDWYLPSWIELCMLYINRNAIGGFADNCYWSSSENNTTRSWALCFFNGEPSDPYKDIDGFLVRAVRSF